MPLQSRHQSYGWFRTAVLFRRASVLLLYKYPELLQISHALLFYLLQHVYLYLHPQAALAPGWLFGVAAVNILLCVGTMVFAGRQILRQAVLE